MHSSHASFIADRAHEDLLKLLNFAQKYTYKELFIEYRFPYGKVERSTFLINISDGLEHFLRNIHNISQCSIRMIFDAPEPSLEAYKEFGEEYSYYIQDYNLELCMIQIRSLLENGNPTNRDVRFSKENCQFESG